MFQTNVLAYAASEHANLVEELLELARVQVVELGEPERALRSVDAAVAITPRAKRAALQEHIWMEGLASFYAGKWERCSRHFEAEMSVNAADVEVPVWRWLCDAHNPQVGAKKARSRLLSCERDARGAPFPEIWDMYKGEDSPEKAAEKVLAAVGRASSEDAKMWGHFYVALYLEALGKPREARPHFEAAAATGSQQNIAKLARTHLLRLQRQEEREVWARLSQQVKPLLNVQGHHQN